MSPEEKTTLQPPMGSPVVIDRNDAVKMMAACDDILRDLDAENERLKAALNGDGDNDKVIDI